MTDHHPKHHLTHACTFLSSHLNQKLGPAMMKSRSITVTSQNHALIHSRLFHLFTNFHFPLFQVSHQLFTSPTRPIWLPFTNTHSHFHLLAQLQSAYISPQLTSQATDTVNLSLSKLSDESLFLCQYIVQKHVGMTAFRANAYPRE